PASTGFRHRRPSTSASSDPGTMMESPPDVWSNRVRAAHIRRLTTVALVDSFGLSVGWAVFILYVVAHRGLAAVGVFEAARLAGVAASAPATGWLSARLHGWRLLRVTAVTEAVLRVAVIVLLIWGAPGVLIALVVFVMNVAAWSGYAGMRAEVAALDA